ncbi:MAG: hypothetical protein POELPBGB_03042 [Bacteroidia bacterium]|nr:hypothetical protein [Bacteroidia bacterium]
MKHSTTSENLTFSDATGILLNLLEQKQREYEKLNLTAGAMFYRKDEIDKLLLLNKKFGELPINLELLLELSSKITELVQKDNSINGVSIQWKFKPGEEERFGNIKINKPL